MAEVHQNIDRPRARHGSGRLLPARLGEYELFDHIGRGGMADIYRARKEGSGGVVRQLVIKEVLPELARSERLAELLAAEARTASKLEHANVVRIEDLQRDEHTLFIAMEYVEGLDLRELMRLCARDKRWIPLNLAVFVARELLRALDYAHHFQFEVGSGVGGNRSGSFPGVASSGAPRETVTGIVHRDVSPSNVLLSFEGEVKLCDFGIARSFESAAGGDPIVVEGKAGYMSPEQAQGDVLDARADIFAAGIVLWELVTGRRLYKAKEGESLFDVAKRAPVRALPKKNLPNEEELRRILARALAPTRNDRYATAGEMQRDLDAYAASAGLRASALSLRKYLVAEFASDFQTAQLRRELATRALAMGPLASIEVVSPTPPEVASPPTITPSVSTPRSRGRWILLSCVLALTIAACVVWLMTARA